MKRKQLFKYGRAHRRWFGNNYLSWRNHLFMYRARYRAKSLRRKFYNQLHRYRNRIIIRNDSFFKKIGINYNIWLLRRIVGKKSKKD